ncbi:MAG: tetratricopeptide repeat protein [Anaerolineales bacterium]|nr:tetratricopeptide repeat protein [Anaerolineales bacterium]
MLSTATFFADLEKLVAATDPLDRQRARALVHELEGMAAQLPRLADKCYVYQARLLMRLAEYEPALVAVEKARLLMPLDDTLLILRGDVFRAAEEYSRALQDYTQVLGARPDSVTARLHRAEVRQAQGQYGEALADLNEALRHEPRSLRLLYRRGLILVDLGRLPEALSDFQTVARLSADKDLKRKARQRLRELGTR